MEIEKKLEILKACRYCPMCRNVCTSGLLTNLESDYPRGRGLILDKILRSGGNFDADSVNSIYNCTLCGCCWANCEGGFKLPDLIKAARIDIVRKGCEPEAAKKIRQYIIKKDNSYNLDIKNSFCNSFKGRSIKKDINSEILFYFGQEINYKNHEIAGAQISIFNKLNMGFSIIKNEISSGKILSLLGYVDDAKNKAEELYNEIFKRGVKKLIVSDPLDYDAFINDYPQWGLNFKPDVEVYHISEFLLALTEEGNFTDGEVYNRKFNKVTIVNSEYLCRFNNICSAPEKILKIILGDNFVPLKNQIEKYISTCEGAVLFKGERFSMGHVAANNICKIAKDMGVSGIVVLSASAKNMLQSGCELKIQEISEFVSEML